MKQPPFKKLFIIVGSLIVLSGFVWVIAQSDTASLVIDTDKFNAVQEIQEVHLNELQGNAISSTRAGMKVEKPGVLGIGTVDATTNRVGALKNTVNSDTSIIAGSENRNEAWVGAFILWGEKNRASGTKVNSLIVGSTATEVSTSGTIILASSGVRISAPNVVAIGLENVRVNAGNAILQAGSGVTINKPGAFTVGSNITVNHDGVFVFNAQGTTNTAKEHTFLVNADQGMMVGTDNNLLGSSVQLTVSGAVKLGRENACTTAQNGAVYKYPCPNNSKYACLCGCTSAGAVSLSNHKACAGVCDAGASCVIQPQCGDRATAHEAGETTWRPFSNFCADGQDVIGTEPRFPAQGSSVTWQCPSPFDKNIVKTCTATRKKELGGGKTCFWTIPSNAVLASSNETTGLTVDTERKLVASNTSAKCEYVCAAGYVYNALSQSCVVPNYQCTGQTPANSELIPGDDQGLTANTPKKLVTSNTSAKCEYVCADGYTNVGGSCTSMGAGYQCTGITPANSVLVPGDNLGLTANTPKKLVASNTSAKCEYVCADNFKYENGKCVPKQWRCTKFEQTYQNNVGAEDKCNKAPKTFVDWSDWFEKARKSSPLSYQPALGQLLVWDIFSGTTPICKNNSEPCPVEIDSKVRAALVVLSTSQSGAWSPGHWGSGALQWSSCAYCPEVQSCCPLTNEQYSCEAKCIEGVWE